MSFKVTITWKRGGAIQVFRFSTISERRASLFPEEISHLAGVIYQVADGLHWFEGRRAELEFADYAVEIEKI